jgi:hypothetical protein
LRYLIILLLKPYQLDARHGISTGEKLLTKTETIGHTFPISKFLSLRLYLDNNPQHHHIADLQKGLILVYKGKERVGEGTGFGVPVVRYREKEYFSGSSTMRIFQKNGCTTAIKQFSLDMVSERRFGKVKIENKKLTKLVRRLEVFYQKHGHWTLLMLKIYLFKVIGVKYSFVRVEPVGDVTVTYRVDPPIIHVKADFKSLRKDCLEKIFLLNEQGARFFRKYYDSDGILLYDKQIGSWETVEADWACVSDNSGEVGFRLWKVKDAVLRRGSEFIEGNLDWVGLDYEVGPSKSCLEYDIKILGIMSQK